MTQKGLIVRFLSTLKKLPIKDKLLDSCQNCKIDSERIECYTLVNIKKMTQKASITRLFANIIKIAQKG